MCTLATVLSTECEGFAFGSRILNLEYHSITCNFQQIADLGQPQWELFLAIPISKSYHIDWMQEHMPVTLADWETEVGGGGVGPLE